MPGPEMGSFPVKVGEEGYQHNICSAVLVSCVPWAVGLKFRLVKPGDFIFSLCVIGSELMVV